LIDYLLGISISW